MSLGRALLALLFLGAAACAPQQPEFHGSTFEELKAAEDFTLTDQYGEPFRLADHRGKIVLLFFGYAHCPDVCPVTLSAWALVEEALGEREDVEYVFITVDPERDTAERLREHLEIFSSEFHGLTGSPEELRAVYRSYGIYQEKMHFSESEVGYVVDHSTVMLLLDREGRLRVSFPFDAEPDAIVQDLKRLLEE